MEYLIKYKITQDKLLQQFIPVNLATTPIEKYPTFLADRAKKLATEPNSHLAALSKDIEV
jgi:hypothetical protein